MEAEWYLVLLDLGEGWHLHSNSLQNAARWIKCATDKRKKYEILILERKFPVLFFIENKSYIFSV